LVRSTNFSCSVPIRQASRGFSPLAIGSTSWSRLSMTGSLQFETCLVLMAPAFMRRAALRQPRNMDGAMP
jgi:hypothetical protein